jgi:hypothetical protein
MTDTTTQNGPEEIPAQSAFHEKNAWPVLLIMLMRLYDLNLALLSCVDEGKAQFITELHERGQVFAPPAAFVQYEDSRDEVP